MFSKIKLFHTISIISTVMFLFSSLSFANEIEIKPVQEGENYYPPSSQSNVGTSADVANSSKDAGLHIMKLNQTQTFEALGFGWDTDTQQKIPDVEIKDIHWTFDSRFLELVKTKDNTITLKAIKARTSRLTVTGEVNGESVSKTIFIVINANDH